VGENEAIRIIEVINKLGLHARPSAMLVQLTTQFDSDLFVQRVGDSDEVNAKSIMGVMMLAAGLGTKLRFRAVGADNSALLDEVEKLFQTKFNED
jgi:phosphocarrier protein